MKSKKIDEAIVRELYARYNPQKLDSVPSLLQKSNGKVGDLLERICKKYSIPADELRAIV